MRNRYVLFGTTTLMGLLLANTVVATEAKFNKTSVEVRAEKNVKNVLLSISGPNGFYTETYSERGGAEINLAKFEKLADGMYRWNITGATNERVEMHKNGLDNGRGEKERRLVYKRMSDGGVFWFKGGKIVKTDAEMKEPRQAKEDERRRKQDAQEKKED